MPNIGPLELAIVLVVVLLIFGPKRLPGLGKQLGTGMREFKESITGKDKDRDDDDDDVRPARGEGRRDVEAALGRPEGETAPLEGDAVRERSPR
jgi:sec-independent protein translocase protein TatA